MIGTKRFHQVIFLQSPHLLHCPGLDMVLLPEPVPYIPPILVVEPSIEMMELTELVNHYDEKFYSTWVRKNILRVSELLGVTFEGCEEQAMTLFFMLETKTFEKKKKRRRDSQQGKEKTD